MPVIKSLWVGEKLSVLERLSLKSFLDCGHPVQLFVYKEIGDIPDGVLIRDASEIVSESQVFRCRASNSYAFFSDIFRFRLLYLEGGIWVDLDMICLKPMDLNDDLIYGKEEYNKFGTAVLGGRKGHRFFKYMMDISSTPNSFLPYDTFKIKRRKVLRRLVNRGIEYTKWGEVGGPEGVTKALRYLNLDRYGLPYEAFYPIHPKRWDSIFDDSYPDPFNAFKNTYAIHLWNEMIKKYSSLDKDGQYSENSMYESLKRRYGVK